MIQAKWKTAKQKPPQKFQLLKDEESLVDIDLEDKEVQKAAALIQKKWALKKV